jgi:hypothetical protein
MTFPDMVRRSRPVDRDDLHLPRLHYQAPSTTRRRWVLRRIASNALPHQQLERIFHSIAPNYDRADNKKAGLPPVTLTLVTVGSPAVFRIRFVKTRDFPPLSYGRFSFCCFSMMCIDLSPRDCNEANSSGIRTAPLSAVDHRGGQRVHSNRNLWLRIKPMLAERGRTVMTLKQRLTLD